ncbi:MAG: polyphosphate kinase 1 [Bacteroidota bacterium]
MVNKSKYFNKELSWLSFNYRVLMEAKDATNPLYERIKFLSIFASNLDEFFRIELGRLKKLTRIKKETTDYLNSNPKKILNQVRAIISLHYEEYQNIIDGEIIPSLEKEDIFIQSELPLKNCSDEQALINYFKYQILTFLKPKVLSEAKRNDFTLDKTSYLAIKLQKKKDVHFAVVNIPTDKLPRFLEVKCTNGHNFIYIDDLIRINLKFLFPEYEILEAKSFRVTQDESINIEDEFAGNLIEKIRDEISKGQNGLPTNFKYDETISDELLDFLKKFFGLKNKDLLATRGKYHNLKDLGQLPNPHQPRLQTERKSPVVYQPFEKADSIFDAIDLQDHLLHFPYHSYNNVLRFINEASTNRSVKEIRITLYRVAGNSYIVNALISAAHNGKKIIVFVEVKARTDEAHNLYWAEQMEKVGITIIYSLPALKVHAKMALVIKEGIPNDIGYAYLSTGNFNESTAKVYSDFGFFTSRKKTVKDVMQIFDYVYKKQPLSGLNELLVTKYNLKRKFTRLIDSEIINKRLGKPARIIIKVNNLEDYDLIDKLHEAGEAGVDLSIIVRGICCFKPNRKFTDHVKLLRLVDTHLEHARVFYFHNSGKDHIYLSSADWMQRNLYNRIEVGFPIKKKKIKELILKLLELQIEDSVKAVLIDESLNNIPVNSEDKRIRSQYETYNLLAADNH